jgi:hypothetical protein
VLGSRRAGAKIGAQFGKSIVHERGLCPKEILRFFVTNCKGVDTLKNFDGSE